MGDFFKSVQFKILALLLALVFAFALRSAQTGTAIPMISKLTGALLTPAQSAATTTVNSTRQFFTEYFSGPRLADENEQIKFPDYIKIIKEVTDDPDYKKDSLAGR